MNTTLQVIELQRQVNKLDKEITEIENNSSFLDELESNVVRVEFKNGYLFQKYDGLWHTYVNGVLSCCFISGKAITFKTLKDAYENSNLPF